VKMQLDMDKIARGLGAERRGKVTASGGYFGALQDAPGIARQGAATAPRDDAGGICRSLPPADHDFARLGAAPEHVGRTGSRSVVGHRARSQGHAEIARGQGGVAAAARCGLGPLAARERK